MKVDKQTQPQANQPGALFISHANPEDNTFTLWLGAKLSAMGYEVWADILRLKGGHDWQRRLENALRDRDRIFNHLFSRALREVKEQSD